MYDISRRKKLDKGDVYAPPRPYRVICLYLIYIYDLHIWDPPKSNTSSFGLESFRWLGPKIWELVPDNLKHAKSLSAFKSALKKLNIDNCPCKLCKDYIHGVGYIN